MPGVDSWTQAVYAYPPVICGRRLLPFSLAHGLLLRALGNPYAYVSRPADRSAVLMAAEVCSRTLEQNRRALFGGRPPLMSMVYRSLRWRKMDVATADASLRTYIADFTRRAPRLALEGGGEPMRAPVEFHLHRHLCEVVGMSDEDAWNCSYALAWAYFDVWNEWKGAKELGTEFDERKREVYERMESANKSGNQEQVDAAWAEMQTILKEEKAAMA